jgi:hypothetical protein
MSDEIINEIRTSMQIKDTDELIRIWQSNNHYEWTDEAFTVIREILLERLGEIPAQNEPVYDTPGEMPKNEADQAAILTTEDKIFGKLYAKINGDIQSEEFFTKRHNTLINFANIANVLAYIILAFSILGAVSKYLSYVDVCNLNGFGCYNINLLLGLLNSGGLHVFYYLTQVLWSIGRGVIYSVGLWGISAGLKMIVETDLNYRQVLEEETIPSDSSPDTIFYSSKSALKLEKWLDRAIVIGIFTATLSTIGDFGNYHGLIYSYLFSLGQNHPLVILLSILLCLLNIAFYGVVIYFPVKALIKILQILMQMEMNSRKAK